MLTAASTAGQTLWHGARLLCLPSLCIQTSPFCACLHCSYKRLPCSLSPLLPEGDTHEHEVAPAPNPRVLTELQRADAVIYGMGEVGCGEAWQRRAVLGRLCMQRGGRSAPGASLADGERRCTVNPAAPVHRLQARCTPPSSPPSSCAGWASASQPPTCPRFVPPLLLGRAGMMRGAYAARRRWPPCTSACAS